jgi:hypothetical protein
MDIGTTFYTQSFVVHPPEGDRYFWFSVPENMPVEEAFNSQEHHGPFTTQADADENQRLVLLGEQCQVVPGAPISSARH